ncbi:MAG: Ig-like domain-containing protein, partial [Pseudomonadota bacterium]
QWVSIRMTDESGGTLFEEQIPSSELAYQRVTLGYDPATSDDHDLILANGGLALTPPALVRLRPVLFVNGQPRWVGHGVVPMATDLQLEVVLSSPGGAASMRQYLVVGGLSALYFGAGEIDLDAGLAFDVELADSEQVAAGYLGGLLRRYVSQWALAERQLATLADARLIYPVPGVVMLNLLSQSEMMLGVPTKLDVKAVVLDAALRPVEAISETTGNESAWYQASSLHGSILEHRVFENQWNIASVSADRVLALADSLNIPLVVYRAGDNLSDLPPDLIEPIQVALAQDLEVVIPASPIAVDSWTGYGWMARDPESGEAGFFITGHYAGGSTVEAPEDWILEFLSDALRFPYSEPSNKDPLSAARIRKIPASDRQIVSAGQVAPQPLTVLVTDRFGRPVEGAEVSFVSVSEQAEFPSSGGSLISVLTDSLGIASADVRVREVLSSTVLLRLSADHEFATRVSFEDVQALVNTDQGVLSLDAPLRSLVRAGEPATLQRLWNMPSD